MTAPLIVKWRYWDNQKCRTGRSGNYLNYIGLREGVEKFDTTWRSNENKTYLDYIGTRPRVERTGQHGLFSDEGTVLDLDTEREKLNAHSGIVHTLIVSLAREDAEATGFNNAERYRSFMRTQKTELSKQFGIPMESLHWYGAFHNESSHPHIHVLLYSSDPESPGYLQRKGLEHIKRTFATEIFRHELDSIYEEQKKQRDELTQIARDELAELVLSIRNDSDVSPQIVRDMQELSEKLNSVSGKKVYGYLPAELKTLVDQITDELCEDERLKRLYDLWYESKYAVLKCYTQHLPPKKPLSQEETFKPIRNAVIREATRISFEQTGTANNGDTHTSNNIQKNQKPHRKSVSPFIASLRLLADAGSIIDDKIDQQLRQHPEFAVDSKLRREIEAKKQGLLF